MTSSPRAAARAAPSTLRALLRVLAPTERRQLGGALALWVLTGGFELAGLGLVFAYVASVSGRALPWSIALPFASRGLTFALVGGLILISFYVAKSGVLAGAELGLMRVAARAHTRVASTLFEAYLGLDWEEHLRRSRDAMRRRIVGQTTGAFAEYLPASVRFAADSVLVAALAAILAYTEPGLTLALAALLGVVAFAYVASTRHTLTGVGAARQERLTELNGWIAQALAGVKEVRLLGREGVFVARHRSALSELLRLQRRLRGLELVPRSINELALVIGLVTATLYVTATGVSLIDAAPTLTLFAVAGLRGASAASRLLSSGNTLRLQNDAVRDLLRELAIVSARPEKEGHSRASGCILRREIAFEAITFAYRGDTRSANPASGSGGDLDRPAPAVEHISLRIARGTFVAFVGPSGGGKSTLLYLLCGLLRPQSGRILVDGVDVFSNLQGWQNQIAYIPQAPYMAPDTVRRNVAFGVDDDEIDDERVLWALEQAQVVESIRHLPAGFDTHMRDEAAAFSGGERQRVAIARALYADRPVIVVDEATASLDQRTERAVADVLLGLAGPKTLIAVAHRLATVRRAHRLLYIEASKLCAEGTFEVLVSSCAPFARLVELGELG